MAPHHNYAVFIYECGGMEWGRGVIGWQASTTLFEKNTTSVEALTPKMWSAYIPPVTAQLYTGLMPVSIKINNDCCACLNVLTLRYSSRAIRIVQLNYNLLDSIVDSHSSGQPLPHILKKSGM